MFIEILFVDSLLRAWKKRPDATAIELSLNRGETRNRPFTDAEVDRMKAFHRLHNPIGHRQLFGSD